MDDEFTIIKDFFKPLSGQGSLALEDDVAWLRQIDNNPSTALSNLVISKDLLVAQRHFFATDPYDLIARKAIRVNVSDIIAKGAKPFGYFLGCVFPLETSEEQIRKLASGLKKDQAIYGLSLLGGDTTRHGPDDGPLTLSVTILGKPLGPKPILRQGAQPGDLVFVTGTIGSACLGLAARQGTLTLPPAQRASLLAQYHLPNPPAALASIIAQYASASIDVSDGLIADAGHLAVQSALYLRLQATQIPLDKAARAWLGQQTEWSKAMAHLVSGGDDYQVCCTVPAKKAALFQAAASAKDIVVSQIGQCEGKSFIATGNDTGAGTVATPSAPVIFEDAEGEIIPISKPGYQHFS